MPVLSQYAFCVNKQNQNQNLLLKLRSGDVKKSRAFTLVVTSLIPISNLSFPVCSLKLYYTAEAQVVTWQSLVGRVAVAPTNWQLTLAKRKRPLCSLVS